MNYLLFCIADREDTQLNSLSFRQFLSAGNDGGTCCYDVIDDEQMLAFDLVGINQLKGLSYVLATFPDVVLMRLALCEMLTHNYLIVDRQMSDMTNAASYLHTLVVASLPMTLACDGDGYDGIDIVEKACWLMS